MLTIMHKVLWAIATSMILLSSVYYSIKLKWKQFKLFSLFKEVFNKKNKNSYDALMLTLAGRIGVGSIAGIALGIYIGGVGTIFWLWVTTFIVSILSYVETILGIKYQEKNNVCVGGPSYYIKKGLNNSTLATLYAILIIVCYVGGFLGIQANTITKGFNSFIIVPNYITAIMLAILTSLCIFKGLNSITKITSKLVPFMTIFYLVLCVYVLCVNSTQMPEIICNIFKSAFGIEPITGGIISTCIIGLQRGIFSNEAGLGTGSITSSICDKKDIEKQACLQVIGVYITSLLICTATAFFIMTTDYVNVSFIDMNGIELMQHAFSYHFGCIGEILLLIFIFLFAFSTILTGYYYGEAALLFILKKRNNVIIFILKLITLVVILIGCIIKSTTLWLFVDILVSVLAIINIYALLKLSYIVK